MKRIALMVAAGALLGGCASHGGLQAETSGRIGCSPADIEVSNKDIGWSTITWTAQCKGKTFHCVLSEGGGPRTTTCTPQVE